jgi:uncharacterized protein
MKDYKIATDIRRAKKDYSDTYDAMKWLTPKETSQAAEKRELLLNTIFNHHAAVPEWRFSGTKLFNHAISPGCNLCGQGDWSCLFINGICNAKCFYCPSNQNEKGQPVTSTVEFSSPNDYADYINAFDIKGVSFSGGEPFMTFDRVLLYLKTLREKVSHPLYIWMYTNGLLVTKDKLMALKDHGLDEIRFDISANKYHLDALKKAVGIIPCVTVEIPAIPEDLPITKPLMKELYETGVNYLNLHQIRCTTFNIGSLIKRGYTFVNGPAVTVMETEMAALELIRHALETNIDLPINYCSFTYRHQFQRAGAQRRNALRIKAEHEDITPTGHIRALSILGTQTQIGSIHEHLLSKVGNLSLWSLSKRGEQLFFNADLWPFIDFSNVRLKVVYSGTSLKSSVSFRYFFKEIVLNKRKKIVIERHSKHKGIFFEGVQIREFGATFIRSGDHFPESIESKITLRIFDEINGWEHFSPGLAHYF